jgi:hypothetical protein
MRYENTGTVTNEHILIRCNILRKNNQGLFASEQGLFVEYWFVGLEA